MRVAEISQETAEMIAGMSYSDLMLFNPVLKNGKWVISLAEAAYLLWSLWQEIEIDTDSE